MLIVKQSPHHGRGVFTDSPIPKGTFIPLVRHGGDSCPIHSNFGEPYRYFNYDHDDPNISVSKYDDGTVRGWLTNRFIDKGEELRYEYYCDEVECTCKGG